jgi:hypothetical protein
VGELSRGLVGDEGVITGFTGTLDERGRKIPAQAKLGRGTPTGSKQGRGHSRLLTLGESRKGGPAASSI